MDLFLVAGPLRRYVQLDPIIILTKTANGLKPISDLIT